MCRWSRCSKRRQFVSRSRGSVQLPRHGLGAGRWQSRRRISPVRPITRRAAHECIAAGMSCSKHCQLVPCRSWVSAANICSHVIMLGSVILPTAENVVSCGNAVFVTCRDFLAVYFTRTPMMPSCLWQYCVYASKEHMWWLDLHSRCWVRSDVPVAGGTIVLNFVQLANFYL